MVMKEHINHVLIAMNWIFGIILNIDDFIYEIEFSKIIEFHKQETTIYTKSSHSWNPVYIVIATIK